MRWCANVVSFFGRFRSLPISTAESFCKDGNQVQKSHDVEVCRCHFFLRAVPRCPGFHSEGFFERRKLGAEDRCGGMRECRFFFRPISKSSDFHNGEHLRRWKLGAEDYSGDVRECRFLLRAFSGVHL